MRSRRLLARAALAGALFGVAVFLAGSSPAATAYEVVTTAADPGNATCTSDPGGCSLRAAIQAVENAGGGAIYFNIPSTAPPTITLESPLPAITVPVVIDGAPEVTAPGVTIAPVTGLSGPLLDLAAGSDGSTVHGLAFGGNAGAGGTTAIQVESNGDTIAGNWIGVGADSSSLGTSDIGIDVTGSDNTVGGAGAGNVITGSTAAAISVESPGGATMPDGNVIQGNLVGLNPDGSPAAGGGVGISVADATNTLVGNNADPSQLGDVQANPQFGNEIAGASQAIDIVGGSTGTIAAGNFVGVDRSGESTKPNANGIVVSGSSQLAPGAAAAPFTAISAGDHHTCALTREGGVECWGSNSFGQLGDGTTKGSSTPVAVTGLSSGVTAISAGAYDTCALTSAGGVECWGSNDYGQLGDGTTKGSSTPVAVSRLPSGVTAISARDDHTCALTSAGGVECWGYNGNGQLGDGTTTSSSVPVGVSGLSSGVAAISAGYLHTCALTTRGGVECWGDNTYGELGNGTFTSSPIPVAVAGLSSGATAISAAIGGFGCALTTGGGVECWGYNGDGELGDGTTSSSPIPVGVSGLSGGVSAISAGFGHVCALTGGGAPECWGSNSNGQLGDATTTGSLTPVAVSRLPSGVTAINAGLQHTCALTTDGGAKCWGQNTYGELGNGTTTDSSTPVDVVFPSTNENQIGPGNVIAHSGRDGVSVDGRFGDANGNRIVANSIFDNNTDGAGSLGIHLYQGNGTSANDGIAAPVITSISDGTVSGTNPNDATVFIEIFTSPSCGGAYASGAGKTYVQYVDARPGPWTAVVSGLAPGEGVTATATDEATNDTSEFSNCGAIGSLSGSVDQSIVKPVDVTAAGTSDWAVWGYGSSPVDQPSSALTPNETKTNGGRQISNLSIVNGDGTATRGFGSFAGVPYAFSWTDGSPDASVTGGYAGLTAPKVGQGLSFTVPADTRPRTLTIWTSAHYADGTLTAHLSDGSAPDYTETIRAVAGQFTDAGENVPASFTLQYNAASPHQHLTVTWTQDTNNGCEGCDDVVLYAAALSGGGGTATSASASLTTGQSVGMSGSNDQIADIPLSAFEVTPTGVTPAPINGLPINGLPINGLPINGLPINGLPINGLPINGLPINGLPINGLPINGLPINGLPINGLPINGLPINGLGLLANTSWEQILAGTPLAGLPLQTITLQQVLDLSPQPNAVKNLTLGDLEVVNSQLGQMTIGALALGSTPINGLGSDVSTIEQQLQAWCEGAITSGDPATDCSLTNIGNQSLFALGLAGAPINGLPINGLPINGLPINGLPINGLPINGLNLSASPINGLPINGLPINGLPINGLPPVLLSDVVDCTKVDCSTATLGQAAAAGAIKKTATILDLLRILIADGSPYKDTITLGDVIGLLIQSADVPWETLPPRLLSVFDPSRPKLNVSAGFTLQGSGTPNAYVQLTIPDGFDYDPGSATISAAGGDPQPLADPTVDGRTLAWQIPVVDPGVPYTIAFKLRSGTTVGPAQVTETVSSGSQSGSSVASFSVTDSYPGSNDPSTAPTITPDTGVQMSALPTPGAVDYYRIPMPAAGTRIQVHLTNLPADYDLALYSTQTTSVRTGATSALPLQDGIVSDQQINLAGGPNGQLTPTALQDVPNPGIPLVQVSANRGTTDEDVGMVSPGGGGYITIAVFGYNGAFSPKPYSLRVKTVTPTSESCTRSPFPYGGQGTTPDSLPSAGSLPSNLNTVILVNEKRLGDTYGATGEANAVAKLNHLAGDASLGVSGVVVPVEKISGVQALYDTWDSNPCDPSAANAVANAIANEVDSIVQARPGVKYVVFAGGDDQIPFFRLPDLSYIANESGFSGQFSPNEYQGSLAAGDLLSDDPYLDTQPVPASGQQLFPPNLAGGRLVETAQEIANAVTAFETAPTPGALKSSTAFVSGYDFVADGSQRVADNLSALGVNVQTLANPLSATSDWSASDLLAAAFPATGSPADINSWNGHYDNTRTQTANGDVLSTADLPSGLNGGIFFTMGCHAGFQTTDAIVGPPGVLDWPQYFAQHDTGFVGNTGFGLGDTDSVAFSEELMSDLAGNLGGSQTLGQALMQAKQQYYLSRVAFSNYDVKTLSEAELYGLPMYGVGQAPASLAAAASPTPSGPVTGTTQSTSPSQGPLSSFPGTGVQSATFAATPHFVGPTTGQNGQYFTNDGQVQAPNYRPLQPYVSLPAARSGLVAHGVVIDGLTSTDTLPFTPDNVRPILNSSATEPPPTFTDEAWPEKIPTLVSLGSNQNLNLITGQFFTETTGTTTTGVERLWTQIDGRVTYSSSQDFTPPTIDSINGFLGNGVAAFTGRFSDLDQNGNPGTVDFAQVVYDDGNGQWNALPLHYDPTSQTWSGGAPFGGQHLQFFVEACDAAGNCGYSSNKGGYFDAQPLPSSTGTLTLTPDRAPDSTSWYTGSLDVTAASSAQTVEVSVDGGPFAPVSGPIALTTDGVHIVQARDSDGNSTTGVYLIDTTPPTKPAITGISSQIYPVGDLPAASAIGCTATDVTSGLRSCVVTGYSAAFGAHTLTATATDNAGNTSTSTLDYTVGFEAGDILPPVTAPNGDQADPNAPDLQVFKLTSTVPLKFRFYLDSARTTLMTGPPLGSYAVLTLSNGVGSQAESGDVFRWAGSQYIYNLSTKPLTAGEYACTITLHASDGTVLAQSAKQYFVLRQ